MPVGGQRGYSPDEADSGTPVFHSPGRAPITLTPPGLRRTHTCRGALLRPAGDECGNDVAGVPIEVVPGAVVAGRRPGIGVAGGDLNVTERHPSVEGSRDEAVPQRVGGDVLDDAGPSGHAPNDAGSAMTIEALSGSG